MRALQYPESSIFFNIPNVAPPALALFLHGIISFFILPFRLFFRAL